MSRHLHDALSEWHSLRGKLRFSLHVLTFSFSLTSCIGFPVSLFDPYLIHHRISILALPTAPHPHHPHHHSYFILHTPLLLTQ